MNRIVVMGLGPIGIAAAVAVQRAIDMQLVGLVDIDPRKLGKRLTELTPDAASDASADEVAVVSDVAQLPDADVAILCTASYFDRVAPDLRLFLRRKMHVVSSCEQMTWPWLSHPHLSDVINAEAKSAGVALIGTGVNPGFVMDVLPVALSSMTLNVRQVRVTRVVDALLRRLPLQRKIGSTMTPAHFHDLAKQHKIGHMGLGESVVMLAQGLGRHPLRSEIQISLAPVIADREIESAMGVVLPGQVCGIRNVGRYKNHGLDVELDLTMSLGAPNPRDEITITGDRTITTIIPGSTPGDTATVAALVNVARVIIRAPAGLRTMLDLPVVGSM